MGEFVRSYECVLKNSTNVGDLFLGPKGVYGKVKNSALDILRSIISLVHEIHCFPFTPEKIFVCPDSTMDSIL